MPFLDYKNTTKEKYTNISPILLGFLSLLLCMSFGCASQKATSGAPELPPSHWLDEAPGVPVEQKAKLEAAVPNLYDPQKSFTFEDCVYLTIQQSPALVNSAVDLEIKKVQLTNAIWQYLPEPKATLTVSNNITTYNKDMGDLPSDYTSAKYSIGFYAAFPNPLQTYFNHQAQKIMVNLAISTHRKAVSSAIFDIAEMYQRLEAQRQIIEIQKELAPWAKKLARYWKELESVDGRQGVALNLALQRQKEVDLRIERTQIERNILLTRLKVLVGIEPYQNLNLDTKDADNILQGFNGKQLSWEDRWMFTEDQLLLRAQVQLRDYGILLAWARYVPDMTLQVNQNPPSGQYQPADGQDDSFVHLNLDFPLIDWGSRYRGVQTARMQKAQAFQEQTQARTKFANSWTEAEQNVILAETSMKIAATSLEVAKMEVTEAQINFKEGITAFPVLSSKEEALINAKINFINAELDYKLAQLVWMDVASVLKERYIGGPAKDVL